MSVSVSPHPHWCLVHSVKIMAILECVKWYLIVELVCISSVTSDIFHVFIVHLCILFLWRNILKSMAHFKIVFFKLSCKNYSYIYNKTFVKCMTCEYFIPLFFHFLDGIFWSKTVFNLRKFNLSIFLLLFIIFKKPKVTKFYSNIFS